MPLWARLLNVFAIPGAVFDEVKATRRSAANWLVPALIAGVVGSIVTSVFYSEPEFQKKLKELSDTQIQAVEQKVSSGQMTRQDADLAKTIAAKLMTPKAMRIFGAAGAVTTSFVSLFGWGLVVWFAGRRFLRVRFDYMKAVEVTGLASMISVLGMIVKLLLIVNLGKLFSTKTPGVAIPDFDPNNPNYPLIIAMNVFVFWFIAVLAIGLGRLAGVPYPRAMFLLLGFWMLMVSLLLMAGLGALAL